MIAYGTSIRVQCSRVLWDFFFVLWCFSKDLHWWHRLAVRASHLWGEGVTLAKRKDWLCAWAWAKCLPNQTGLDYLGHVLQNPVQRPLHRFLNLTKATPNENFVICWMRATWDTSANRCELPYLLVCVCACVFSFVLATAFASCFNIRPLRFRTCTMGWVKLRDCLDTFTLSWATP